MFKFSRVGLAVVTSCAVVVGSALLSAAPANADEASYLAQVQPRFTSLSADQLLAAGYRVCAVTAGGMPSSEANTVVQHEFGVSVPVSIDITVAARVHLNC